MCNCAVCVYYRKYEEAVKNNDKKFLIEHYVTFSNVEQDLDCEKAEMEMLVFWLKENKLFEKYRKYRNKKHGIER